MYFIQHCLYILNQCGPVDFFTRHDHVEIGICRQARITFDNCCEQECQRFAHLFVKLTHHSEIEQGESPVRQNQHIAGMRVGMEQSFFEDRLQHHSDQGVDYTRYRFRVTLCEKIYPLAV